MRFTPIKLQGAYLVDLESHQDQRGRFARLFCTKEFREIGFDKAIVNINHSVTERKGTVRGLHFQRPPFAETKIVRCLRGAAWDCIVDVRGDSPTFLQWFAVVLTPEKGQLFLIPEGFAHGFQALDDDTEILYFSSAFYSPQHESGLRFNDPALNIDWPLPPTLFSDKDSSFELIEQRKNWNGVVLV